MQIKKIQGKDQILIIGGEGLYPKLYRCSQGRTTIGYGHLMKRQCFKTFFKQFSHKQIQELLKQDKSKIGQIKNLNKNISITKDQAGDLLKQDIKTAQNQARNHWGQQFLKDVGQQRSAVIIDMTYNLGSLRIRKIVKVKVPQSQLKSNEKGPKYIYIEVYEQKWPKFSQNFKQKKYFQAAVQIIQSAYTRQVKSRAIRNALIIQTGNIFTKQQAQKSKQIIASLYRAWLTIKEKKLYQAQKQKILGQINNSQKKQEKKNFTCSKDQMDRMFSFQNPIQIQKNSTQTQMINAFNNYTNQCECGQTLYYNSAHFLSNTLIKAGFKSLQNYSGFTVCKKGRPIQVIEMKKWFQQHKTQGYKQSVVQNRVFASYQQGEEHQVQLMFANKSKELVYLQTFRYKNGDFQLDWRGAQKPFEKPIKKVKYYIKDQIKDQGSGQKKGQIKDKCNDRKNIKLNIKDLQDYKNKNLNGFLENLVPELSNYKHFNTFQLSCLLNNTGHPITSHYEVVDKNDNKYILKADKMKEYLDKIYGPAQIINKLEKQHTGIALIAFINGKGKLAGQFDLVKDGKFFNLDCYKEQRQNRMKNRTQSILKHLKQLRQQYQNQMKKYFYYMP